MSELAILFSQVLTHVKSGAAGSDLDALDVVETVPTGKAWLIKEATFTNVSASSVNVWLQIWHGTSKAFKVAKKAIAAGETLTIGGAFPSGWRLSAGDSVVISASAANAVHVNATGLLLDGATDAAQNVTLICCDSTPELDVTPSSGGFLGEGATIATSAGWQIAELTLVNANENACTAFVQLTWEEDSSTVNSWKVCGTSIAAGETLTLCNLALPSGVDIRVAWDGTSIIHVVASGVVD